MIGKKQEWMKEEKTKWFEDPEVFERPSKEFENMAAGVKLNLAKYWCRGCGDYFIPEVEKDNIGRERFIHQKPVLCPNARKELAEAGLMDYFNSRYSIDSSSTLGYSLSKIMENHQVLAYATHYRREQTTNAMEARISKLEASRGVSFLEYLGYYPNKPDEKYMDPKFDVIFEKYKVYEIPPEFKERYEQFGCFAGGRRKMLFTFHSPASLNMNQIDKTYAKAKLADLKQEKYKQNKKPIHVA